MSHADNAYRRLIDAFLASGERAITLEFWPGERSCLHERWHTTMLRHVARLQRADEGRIEEERRAADADGRPWPDLFDPQYDRYVWIFRRGTTVFLLRSGMPTWEAMAHGFPSLDPDAL